MFKKWLRLCESLENINDVLDSVRNYAKPSEAPLKKLYAFNEKMPAGGITIPEKQIEGIKKVLKEKNKENQNYLKYALGFMMNKPNFLPEDLALAVDALQHARRDAEPKLLPRQIEAEGWFNLGTRANELIQNYKDYQEKIAAKSGAEDVRQKMAGIAEDLTPVTDTGDVKIFHIPRVPKGLSGQDRKKAINERHKLLCKYGKGTEWCTANATGTYHSNYADIDIYTIFYNGAPIYQFSDCNGEDKNLTQFMNVHDVETRYVIKPVAEALKGPSKLPEQSYGCYNLKELLTKDDYEKLDQSLKKEYIKEIFDFGIGNILSFYAGKLGDETYKIIDQILRSIIEKDDKNIPYSEGKTSNDRRLATLIVEILRSNASAEHKKEEVDYFLSKEPYKDLAPVAVALSLAYIQMKSKEEIRSTMYILAPYIEDYAAFAKAAYLINDYDLFEEIVALQDKQDPRPFDVPMGLSSKSWGHLAPTIIEKNISKAASDPKYDPENNKFFNWAIEFAKKRNPLSGTHSNGAYLANGWLNMLEMMEPKRRFKLAAKLAPVTVPIEDKHMKWAYKYAAFGQKLFDHLRSNLGMFYNKKEEIQKALEWSDPNFIWNLLNRGVMPTYLPDFLNSLFAGTAGFAIGLKKLEEFIEAKPEDADPKLVKWIIEILQRLLKNWEDKYAEGRYMDNFGEFNPNMAADQRREFAARHLNQFIEPLKKLIQKLEGKN